MVMLDHHVFIFGLNQLLGQVLMLNLGWFRQTTSAIIWSRRCKVLVLHQVHIIYFNELLVKNGYILLVHQILHIKLLAHKALHMVKEA